MVAEMTPQAVTKRHHMMVITAALCCFLLFVENATLVSAAGNGLALGGLQDMPVVTWQFDQEKRAIIGAKKGAIYFDAKKGVPPNGDPFIDCSVTNDGTKAYISTSDNFLVRYVLSPTGPRLVLPNLVLGPATATAGGVSIQGLSMSPNGRLLALCGNVFRKAGFQSPAGALWLLDTLTNTLSVQLTNSTEEFCVSASFCNDITLVAAFQSQGGSTPRSRLRIFSYGRQRNAAARAAWAPFAAGGGGRVADGASNTVSQVACAAAPAGFVAVARGVLSPIVVESYSLPYLRRTSAFRAADTPGSFLVSIALDAAHAQILARTNASIYVVPYRARSGLIASRASHRFDVPCEHCHTSHFLTYFGVKSASISLPRYGSTAFLTGPKSQLVALNLAASPPVLYSPVPLGVGSFGVSGVCLQGA